MTKSNMADNRSFLQRDTNRSDQNNREVALTAVSQSGRAVQFTPLREDSEVVIAAIRQTRLTSQDAASEFRNNRQMVMLAVKTRRSLGC